MAQRSTKEFGEEAVRLVRTGGRTKRDIADDLGVGVSTLTRWLAHSRARRMKATERAPPGEDVAAELKRLRRENEILRQERDILKKATAFRQVGKSMRFELVDAAKTDLAVQGLCKALGVSESGYFAWRGRPACRRQREDVVLLAHVRSAFALSNGTYGSPRMTHELRDHGLQVGRRRAARLMRDNGLKARQKRRFKRTTDSEHAWPIAPNLIDQDFAAAAPNQKWGVDISYVWTARGGCMWPS